MGVSRQDYLVCGYKFKCEITDKENNKIDIWDDKFLPYIEGHKGVEFSIIYDGMNGEYIVFGEAIAVSNDDGFDFVDIEINLDSEMIKNKALDLFNLIDLPKPRLFLFSHYT